MQHFFVDADWNLLKESPINVVYEAAIEEKKYEILEKGIDDLKQKNAAIKFFPLILRRSYSYEGFNKLSKHNTSNLSITAYVNKKEGSTYPSSVKSIKFSFNQMRAFADIVKDETTFLDRKKKRTKQKKQKSEEGQAEKKRKKEEKMPVLKEEPSLPVLG